MKDNIGQNQKYTKYGGTKKNKLTWYLSGEWRHTRILGDKDTRCFRTTEPYSRF